MLLPLALFTEHLIDREREPEYLGWDVLIAVFTFVQTWHVSTQYTPPYPKGLLSPLLPAHSHSLLSPPQPSTPLLWRSFQMRSWIVNQCYMGRRGLGRKWRVQRDHNVVRNSCCSLVCFSLFPHSHLQCSGVFDLDADVCINHAAEESKQTNGFMSLQQPLSLLPFLSHCPLI